jgi:hypothetical protein
MASRTKKILLGFGIGCGGLILLGLVFLISFFAWLTRPGELLEPERLVGSDTRGFVEWTLSLEDPGTKKFIEGLIERAQSRQNRPQTPLPPQLESLLLGWQEKRNRENLERLFPLSLGWTLRAGEEPGEDRHLFSASLKSAGNRLVFADWILAFTLGMSDQREARRIAYGDETLYQFQMPGRDPLVVFLRGNDVFFTYDMATARQAVDRLTGPAPAAGESTGLEELFAGVPEDRSLRGALTNARTEIFRAWRKIAVRVEDPAELEEMTRSLQGAILSGNLAAEGQLEGRLALLCPDEEWAARNVERAVGAFQDGLDYENLELESGGTADGRWIRIDFRLEGFFGLLERLEGLEERNGGIIIRDREE